MRILTYLFLIVLILAFAGSVFIATQRGTYDVSQSVDIPLPKSSVKQYLNDFYNWENWFVADGDKISISKVSTGTGAELQLNEGDANIKTVAISGDTIIQQYRNGDEVAEWKWVLASIGNQTKITLFQKGQLPFTEKVNATWEGGPATLKNSFAQSLLTRFKSSVVSEIKRFTIRPGNVITTSTQFYVGHSIHSTLENIPRNTNVLLTRLQEFVAKSKLRVTGEPFLIYHTRDMVRRVSHLSVCLPISEEIYVSPESDISTGVLAGGNYFVTTLTGDYSHLPELWTKSRAVVNQKKLTPDPSRKAFEVYKLSKPAVRKPSAWTTLLYLPVVEGTPAEPLMPIEPTKQAPAIQKPKAAMPAASGDPEKGTPTGEIAIP